MACGEGCLGPRERRRRRRKTYREVVRNYI